MCIQQATLVIFFPDEFSGAPFLEEKTPGGQLSTEKQETTIDEFQTKLS